MSVGSQYRLATLAPESGAAPRNINIFAAFHTLGSPLIELAIRPSGPNRVWSLLQRGARTFQADPQAPALG